MFDLISEIGQTLRNNKLRTILTGVSVAWGVFMLIILLGASRGVRNSFYDNMSDRSNNVISFYPGRTSTPYAGYQSGRYIELKSSDIDVLERENRDFVSDASARASVDTATIATMRDVLTGGFEAVYPKEEALSNIEMKYGRFINDRDITDSRRVMVLCRKNAELLFEDAAKAVGQTVRSLGLAWTVVGIYDHPWRSESMVPYSTYKALTGNTEQAWQIDVTVEGLNTEKDGDDAQKALVRTLASKHSFSPDDPNAVWVWNRFSNYLRSKSALGYLDIAVWIIGIFTLLTGIVGVSNIMFVSVRERTHEIGIRRAIGAKPRAILTQILAESVAVTGLFGYIGIFFGMIILQVLSTVLGDQEGFKDPTVDISIAVKVTIALVIAGAMAGLFPALKAIKVKPVEALRDE